MGLLGHSLPYLKHTASVHNLLYKLLHQFSIDHPNVADVPSTTWRVPLQGRHLRRLLAIDKNKVSMYSDYMHGVIQK